MHPEAAEALVTECRRLVRRKSRGGVRGHTGWHLGIQVTVEAECPSLAWVRCSPPPRSWAGPTSAATARPPSPSRPSRQPSDRGGGRNQGWTWSGWKVDFHKSTEMTFTNPKNLSRKIQTWRHRGNPGSCRSGRGPRSPAPNSSPSPGDIMVILIFPQMSDIRHSWII